ncbi:MAG: hypothetical protein WAT70_03175 [Rhizobiaceae bacterium]
MTKQSPLLTNARRLASDRGGNFAIATAGMAAVLMVATGFALNTVAMNSAMSHMRSSVEAALTSTARDITNGVIAEKDAGTAVEAFLDVNSGHGLFSGSVRLDHLTVDKGSKTLTAAVSIATPAVFPLFGSRLPERLSTESATLYSDRRIEVAFVLDVTGSMSGDKIRDLRSAASNAVDTFFGGQSTSSRVRIAIVPYANAVNAGSLAATSVFVERSASDRKAAPANTDPLLASLPARPDNCATERKGAEQYSDAGPDIAMVNRDFLLTGFSARFRTPACPTAQVLPLSGDAKALKARIAGLQANGATAGHIGIQWGWYMLSQRWGDVLPSKAKPGKPAKGLAKFAVIMTDGEFNLSYADAGSVDDVYVPAGKGQARAEAVKLCNEMRKAGIEVFTIGFMLEEKNAKATMKACASPDTKAARHYFEAASGKELDRAFREIAANIEKLTLTR